MSEIKQTVIAGEASESDNEVEEAVIKGNFNAKDKTHYDIPHGVVIDGEAPESDDEIVSFTNTSFPLRIGLEMTESYSALTTPTRSSSSNVDRFNSILHKKLYERNESLWKNLHLLAQSTVLSTSKQLVAADQILLKSQVTLQSVSTTVKKVNTTSSQVLEKFRDVLTANFLPPINI